MNLVELSENLKGVPDDYLVKHVKTPDGSVPQYLALSELQRRQDMRQRFAKAPQSSVADDVVAKQQSSGVSGGGVPSGPPANPPAGGPPAAGIAAAQPPSGGYAEGGGINLGETAEWFINPVSAALGYDPVASLLGYPDDKRGIIDQWLGVKFGSKKNGFDDERAAFAEEFARQSGTSGYAANGYAEGGSVWGDEQWNSYLGSVGGYESGNDDNAQNPYSTASGRFQFIDSTRRAVDEKYGFDPDDRSKETEKARMKAFTSENLASLRNAGIAATPGNAYASHFAGLGGAKKFLRAHEANPNAPTSTVFSKNVRNINPAIFKNSRTLADVMAKMEKAGGGSVPSRPTGNEERIARYRGNPDDDALGFLVGRAEGGEPNQTGGSGLGGIFRFLGLDAGAATADQISGSTPSLIGSAAADPVGSHAAAVEAASAPRDTGASPLARTVGAFRNNPSGAASGILQGAKDFAKGFVDKPFRDYEFNRSIAAANAEEAAKAERAAAIAAKEAEADLPENKMYRELAKHYDSMKTGKDESRRMALLQAGLGIAAGESPFFATNVAKGAQSGIDAWNADKKSGIELNKERFQQMMEISKISEGRRRSQFEMDMAEKNYKLASDRATAYVKNLEARGFSRPKIVDIARIANSRINGLKNPMSAVPLTREQVDQIWLQAELDAIRMSPGTDQSPDDSGPDATTSDTYGEE